MSEAKKRIKDVRSLIWTVHYTSLAYAYELLILYIFDSGLWFGGNWDSMEKTKSFHHSKHIKPWPRKSTSSFVSSDKI